MTYLELCKQVRLVSGIQGTGPTTVIDAQGIEELIALYVKDALIDIMSMRDDWNFLRTSHTFSTIVDDWEYPYLQIFNTATPDIRNYIPSTFTYTDGNGTKSRLTEIDYERLLLVKRDTTQEPAYFAIRPSDNALIIHPVPDGPYTIAFDYYKGPQVLLVDSDVPLIPLSYHQLIVYKAVEKMSIYLASPEIYRAYSTEAARMLGQLMRGQIKEKSWSGRPISGRRRTNRYI